MRLQRLIANIGDRFRLCGDWTLSVDEVIEVMNLDRAETYRKIYQASSRANTIVRPETLTGSFSMKDPAPLVATLETVFGPEAEGELSDAGIFLPHPMQIDLLDLFLTDVAEIVSHHDFRAGEFSDMLRVFGRADRAVKVYLEEYFSIAQMMEEAARRFVATRSFGIPDLALATARGLLQMFLNRHVIETDSLFAAVLSRLRRQAIDEGYIRLGRRAHRQEAVAESSAPDKTWARRVMGLQTTVLTPSLLKRRYRDLMKQYHPDINPDGLDKSKDINNAYCLLQTQLA